MATNQLGKKGATTDASHEPAARTLSAGSGDSFDAADLTTPDSGVFDALEPEEKARLTEEWKAELAKTEDEIQTLRQVLSARVRHSQALKRKLGITPMQEFKTDFQHSLQTVRESDAYQKTSAAFKTAGQKTAEVTSGVTASVGKKLSDLKNTPMYKSFEERVSTGYTNVKAKVSGPPKSESSNFEAMLNAQEPNGTGLGAHSVPVTPTDGATKPIVKK